MAAPELLLDTLDDRRELCRLLNLLPPGRRVAFVNGVCRRLTEKDGLVRGVGLKTRRLAREARRDDDASSRLTVDLFFDLWHLALQYGLDLQQAARELETLVRTQK
jgi:hypothetical protein